VILVIGEIAAGVPKFKEGGIIDIFPIPDRVLDKVGQLLLKELIIAGVKIDPKAGKPVIDQRLARFGNGLRLCVGDQILNVKRFLGLWGLAGA